MRKRSFLFMFSLSLSSSYSVRLGDSDLRPDFDDHSSIDVEVADFIIHPEYVDPYSYFDVGLLKFSQRVTFSDFILPVCLPTVSGNDLDENAGSLVTLTGWGLQSRTDLTTDRKLRRTHIGIFSQMYVYACTVEHPCKKPISFSNFGLLKEIASFVQSRTTQKLHFNPEQCRVPGLFLITALLPTISAFLDCFPALIVVISLRYF